jgi:hypothetical protein
MRWLVLTAVALVAVCAGPASASAATYITPGGESPSCLRATGVPGELTTLGKLKRQSTPTDVLAADPTTITRTGGTDLGLLAYCAEVASGGGVTALAGWVNDGLNKVSLRVTVRESGAGGFSAPIALAASEGSRYSGTGEVAIGVGGNGDIAVIWTETRGRTGEGFESSALLRYRLVMRRRLAGGQFGPAEPVTAWIPSPDFLGLYNASVELDAAGTVTLVWARSIDGGERSGPFGSAVVETARVPRTGIAAPAQRITRRVSGLTSLSLDVAPKGRSVAAWTSADGVAYAEREPGADAFGAPGEIVGTIDEPDSTTEKSDVAVAVRDDGAVVFAWRSLTELYVRTALEARWRPAGGQFTDVKRVWSAATGSPIRNSDGSISYGSGESIVPRYDDSGDAGRATSPPDGDSTGVGLDDAGRITVTWVQEGKVYSGDSLQRGWVAGGTLDSGALQVRRLGSDCRAVYTTVPLAAGGGPLVAWSDLVTTHGPEGQYPGGGGRVHVEPVNAVPAEPSTPEVTLSAPRGTQTVYFDQPVVLPVSCDAACDIRAWVPGAGGDVRNSTGLVLPRAGQGRIRFVADELRLHLAPKRGGTLQVRVAVCDPVTGRRVATKSAALKVARRTPPPAAHVSDVKARRKGTDVIVTWKTDRAARRHVFYVAGLSTNSRRPRFDPYVDDEAVEGSAKRSYSVRLQGRAIKFVQLFPVRADVGRTSQKPFVLPVP